MITVRAKMMTTRIKKIDTERGTNSDSLTDSHRRDQSSLTSAVSSCQHQSSTMDEPLPLYVQDRVPQSSFDALLTRIVAPISTAHPDVRTILESFVESQKAPAYNGPEKSTTREPINHYPLVTGFNTDELTRLKQQIVQELFNSIWREDVEAIALLIQHNLVTANTTSESGQTPLLAAVSTKNIAIVKAVLDLGANCNEFGVVVSDICSDPTDPSIANANLHSSMAKQHAPH
jgi:hypothetical protein